LIKRFTDSIVLALDGDDAGIAAAGRSVGIAYQEDMDVRVVLLPMGKDPADIITSSPEQWKEILATPRDYIDVRLELITHDPKIINTTDRFKVMREHIFPFIGMVRNAIFKDTYVQKIASQLGSDITAVRAEYRRWADANPVISQTTSNNTSSIHAGVPAVSAKNPVSSMVSAQTSSSSLVPRDMVIGLIEILKPQHDMAAYVQRFNELHLDAHTSYEQMIQDMGPLLDELILRVQAKNIPEDTLLETLAGALELVELEKLQTQRQILRAQLSATQGEEHNHIVRELEIITKKIDEERGRMNRG
jgi:DNA primase